MSTSSLDEARATFSRLATPIQITQLDRSASFCWLSHRLTIGSVVLAAHQYGAAFRASSDETPATFTASFPLSEVRGEARAHGTSHANGLARVGFERLPVSEVALQCGFAHFGRFSADYSARFGEYPSTTRARGR